jgi:hypothetical protein
MATRVLAIVIMAVVVVYHVLRVTASQCAGAGCDWYIPFSLLLPLAAIVLAAVTAGLAAYEARARRGWSALLALSGILATIGSILAAVVLSDNDTKVWVATVFVLTVPLTVLMSAAWRTARIR